MEQTVDMAREVVITAAREGNEEALEAALDIFEERVRTVEACCCLAAWLDRAPTAAKGSDLTSANDSAILPLVSNPTTTENYLGKCKEPGCDYVIFATSEDVQDAENFKAVTAGTGVYRVGNNGCFARCSNRHKFFAVKRVKGTYSKDHKCDSRCLNAKGWDCTCSCGGANHGRGHVATIVTASELPPAEEKQHLGEIGQHVRGEVTVTAKRDLDGSTLYSFATSNSGTVVKWFAPSYADPQWEVGKVLTIRAKVKAHSEFRGIPETVVTYVEEVQ